MARVVIPRRICNVPSSATFVTDFYREEFLKHRECLARQREYYSERAITDAERALALILSQLEELCAKADADQVIGRLLRSFDMVTGLSAWSDTARFH